MSEPLVPSESRRRRPWPRVLVRLRRSWLGWMEVLSFLMAVAAAVGRFLIGRWPEPQGATTSSRRVSAVRARGV